MEKSNKKKKKNTKVVSRLKRVFYKVEDKLSNGLVVITGFGCNPFLFECIGKITVNKSSNPKILSALMEHKITPNNLYLNG